MSEPARGRARPPTDADYGKTRAPGDAGSDEPPPVLGRWSRLYALVALELLAVILVLYWLTRRFA